MSRLSACLFSTLVATLPLIVTPIHAADEPTKKPFQVSGVFEAVKSFEIKADTEQLATLKITKLADHGQSVDKGQLVVAFETKDADKKLKEAALALRLEKMKLDEAELAHEHFIKNHHLDVESARRAIAKSRQDHDNYQRVDRQRTIDTADHNLVSSQARVDNAKEELEQLEQMYKEDDLTEESEEIVLTRAKQAVKSALFYHQSTVIQTQRSIKQTLPRTDAERQAAIERAERKYATAKLQLRNNRERKTAELTKTQKAYAEQKEKLEKLQIERQRLVLNSPADGIVVLGKLTRGRLSDKPPTVSVDSSVTNKQTILTVLDMRRMQVRIDMAEANLSKMPVGTEVQISPVAMPDTSFAGKVASLSAVPYAGTKYDCVVTFRAPRNVTLAAGMTCQVKLVADKAAPAKKASPKKPAADAKPATEAKSAEKTNAEPAPADHSEQAIKRKQKQSDQAKPDRKKRNSAERSAKKPATK